MKSQIRNKIIFLLLFLGMFVIPQKVSSQVSVSFQVFYDDLSPYGYWVDNSDYGYVWVPTVTTGFVPYATNGYWIYTDLGWTWVSYYSWGWAPFHYGRWYYDPFYGYVWVPGNEWGPAWVVWRNSGPYYSWCPIGPGSYVFPGTYWTIIKHEHLGRTNVSNYYIRPSNNTTIIQNSTVINNAGPERGEVEKYSGRSITQVRVKDNGKPGQSIANNELQIYKPRVQNNNSNGTAPVPSKVRNTKEGKAPSQKPAEATPQKASPQVRPAPSQKEQPRQVPTPQQRPQPKEQPTPQQPKQQPIPQQQQPRQQPSPQQPSPPPQKMEPPPQPHQPPSQPKQPNPPPNQGGGRRPR